MHAPSSYGYTREVGKARKRKCFWIFECSPNFPSTCGDGARKTINHLFRTQNNWKINLISPIKNNVPLTRAENLERFWLVAWNSCAPWRNGARMPTLTTANQKRRYVKAIECFEACLIFIKNTSSNLSFFFWIVLASPDIEDWVTWQKQSPKVGREPQQQ